MHEQLSTTAMDAQLDEDAFDPDVWTMAERRLLTKMLAEFAYEDVVDPERVDNGDPPRYRIAFGDVAYRFRAEPRLLDSYRVRGETVQRRSGDGNWQSATDPIQLLVDAQDPVGIDGLTAGHLVREYRNTLVADAHILARERRRDDPADVTEQTYAEVEGEMHGHPWITYNKGRIGFDYGDYRRYAPEQREPVTLSWLAVDRDHATFASVEGVDHDGLLADELGGSYETFRSRLRSEGVDPDDYYLLPVHEWQWENSVVQLFAKELATDRIVPLGEGPDAYRPMQSVRTFVNVDDSSKCNVKLPMRILNTLVYRGLPGERTEAAPLVTEYVTDVRDGDPFLRDECELVLPGEVAGLNYDHPEFTALDGAPYQYRELLGCVWRESVEALVEADERPITLSALMHVADGEPFVSQLVEESGLSLEAWLDELFGTVLPPLLHYLYRYGTVFSPHGQNAIVVLADGVPTRLAVKDFADDVNVSEHPLPELADLPPELDAVLRTEPPEGLCQFVFSGLFVCVLRYVSDVLTEHHDYPEERFWTQVREAVLDYQARFPELEDRFELFDLLGPECTRLCLNRNRMLDYGYGDAAGRPHAAEHGTVTNPLYEVAHED